MFDDFFKVQEMTPDTPEHAKAHDRIGGCALFSSLVFYLLGLGFSAIVLNNPDLPKLVNGLVGACVAAVFAAGGLGFGVAMGCLWAPRDFFSSTAGRGWMRLVGTRNVRALRVICGIVTATVLSLVVLAVYVAVISW
jgi:hypothetical protein